MMVNQRVLQAARQAANEPRKKAHCEKDKVPPLTYRLTRATDAKRNHPNPIPKYRRLKLRWLRKKKVAKIQPAPKTMVLILFGRMSKKSTGTERQSIAT